MDLILDVVLVFASILVVAASILYIHKRFKEAERKRKLDRTLSPYAGITTTKKQASLFYYLFNDTVWKDDEGESNERGKDRRSWFFYVALIVMVLFGWMMFDKAISGIEEKLSVGTILVFAICSGYIAKKLSDLPEIGVLAGVLIYLFLYALTSSLAVYSSHTH